MHRSQALWRATLAAAIAVLFAPGCSGVVDDQRIVGGQDTGAVNPIPEDRDFAGQNARHRVLLAAIDTGVDYNQPFLSENMHFTLDAFLKPQRLGHDFVGEDGWPAPYIARTSRYDRNLDEETRFKSQMHYFNAVRLCDMFPDMKRFFDPSRYVWQETTSSAAHGTHVAGLMVYDRPDIGLLAYRVLPYNRYPEDAQSTTISDHLDDFARLLHEAIEAAVADGARVINMSLQAGASDANPAAKAVINVYRRDFALLAAAHPSVLFVAAAGNAAILLDEDKHVTFPCGAWAPNVFCVGALEPDGDATAFTSIPTSPLDAVFVLGKDVLSTVPVNMCNVDLIDMLDQDHVTDDQLASLAAAARAMCVGSNHLKRMSGTSMAAPLVSRVAGEILIERPELDGAGVIQEIYRRSTPAEIGGRQVLKLRVPIPSWYLREQPPANPHLPGSGTSTTTDDADGYWEAYLPSHDTTSP